jgi:hypothetical protein
LSEDNLNEVGGLVGTAVGAAVGAAVAAIFNANRLYLEALFASTIIFACSSCIGTFHVVGASVGGRVGTGNLTLDFLSAIFMEAMLKRSYVGLDVGAPVGVSVGSTVGNIIGDTEISRPVGADGVAKNTLSNICMFSDFAGSAGNCALHISQSSMLTIKHALVVQWQSIP